MRALLIDDDSATAQSIELMLKAESFNVDATDLGEEGVDLGKLYDYDIILLDLNRPDMSGFEVLRTLRLSKVKTPIPIVTGLAGIKDKCRGLGFGGRPGLSSPRSRAPDACLDFGNNSPNTALPYLSGRVGGRRADSAP
jgi:two-component system, cell cycle response regulator CtrA